MCPSCFVCGLCCFLKNFLLLLSDVEVSRYIEQWQHDGHSMQPLDDANRGSVIDRHLEMSKHTIFGGKFTGEDKSGEHDSDTDDCDSDLEEGGQQQEQGEEQEGVQEGEQGEGQGEEQRQVQGQEQGEEQKGGSEDEEDVPLAVLKQRRDAAYTAAKQKKREGKKKSEGK